MISMETSNLTKETLKKMFAEGKRFDGRNLLEFRDISIEIGVSNKAEGSTRVRLGKTDVIVGVKLAPGEPYPDSPDKGNLSVSCDLLPLASPRFEMGPPGFYAIELPRLVDRAIRGSSMIELEKLFIEEGKVWTVFIDIYPINDDGNLIDASTIGAIIALKNTMIPVLDEKGMIDYEKKPTKKLPLSKTYPFSFTFYKLGNSIIMDPTREEEEACDARITFGVSYWNNQYMVNSCQKTGELSFSKEEISKITNILSKKFDEMNEKLKKFL
ncbi:MAG: exosome complex protein Rrp42 [Candidatus Pacearchaeota archaeon]|nr:exosome complex protein Rrp42 [Candidatus Pacearchaeota archaeon]